MFSAGPDTKEEAESYADRLRREGVVATYALNSKKIHRNVRDISGTADDTIYIVYM